MLVVDASCLYEVLTGGPVAEPIRAQLALDQDQAAPHVIDVEVMGVIRGDWLSGRIDDTACDLAIEDLRDWPGERFDHRPLLDRAWELRAQVRGWDAVYVALAEGLGGTLLTLDGRLASASGPTCPIHVVAG